MNSFDWAVTKGTSGNTLARTYSDHEIPGRFAEDGFVLIEQELRPEYNAFSRPLEMISARFAENAILIAQK